MPLADYECPGCPGLIRRDVYFSSLVGATAAAPVCAVCETVMDWIPKVGAIDAKEPFQRFTVYQDGRAVEIDSLHKVRQIERDSEQKYVNGEGEPLRFRGYANNASNKDQGSFGEAGAVGQGSTARSYASGQAPAKKSNLNVRRHGERKPERRDGPGVRGGATALPLK